MPTKETPACCWGYDRYIEIYSHNYVSSNPCAPTCHPIAVTTRLHQQWNSFLLVRTCLFQQKRWFQPPAVATLISLDWIQTGITHTTQTSDEYPPQTNNPTPCGPHKAQGDFTFSFRYMRQHSHWGFGRWQDTRVIIDDVVSKPCSLLRSQSRHCWQEWGTSFMVGHFIAKRSLMEIYMQWRKTCSNIASTTAHSFARIPKVTEF